METNKELKNKVVVTVIALTAFFCTMFSGVISFLTALAREAGGKWVTQYVFQMPSIDVFLQYLLSVSAYMVFIVYILMFYNEKMGRIFLPIIFGIVALNGIWTLVNIAIESAQGDCNALSWVVAIARIVVFAVATAFAIFKPNKWIYVGALAFEFVAFFCNLSQIIEVVNYYISYSNYLFAFNYPLNSACILILCSALLVFVLSNDFKAKKQADINR